MLKHLCISAMLIIFAAPVFSSEAELIDFLQDELSDIREEIEARDAAPSDAGFLSKDKDDYQERLDKILDKAIQIISPDTLGTWLGQIDKIQENTSDAETRRAELLLDRMEAKTSEGVGMVRKILGKEHESGSIEDIDQQLEQLDAALAQLSQDQEAIAIQFAVDIREVHNVTLTSAQAKAILYSVNGGLIVESSVVLNVLGDVERRLAELMRQQIGPDAQRTYIGVASAARLVHVRMLQRHLKSYEGDWLPELDAMRRETQDLLAKTRRDSIVSTQDSVRKTFASNIKTQERILKVVDQYEAMLKRRQQLTAEALVLAKERAGAAVNTLMTLETAAGVSSVIAEASSEYEAVMSVDLPELEQLNSEEFEEILDISRRLGS